MSQTGVDPQFQTLGSHLSNLDRCNRCGAPRSVHGTDWTCPTRLPRGCTAVPIILGILLALGGLGLRAQAAQTQSLSMLVTAALLVGAGTTLAVAGALMVRRPR